MWSLQKNEYRAIGLDSAKQTVEELHKNHPGLEIILGDVRDLPFKDNYFAGYWSLGVIEHFWAGYHPIISEMQRVIKPGGYLFLTFPCMSPIRKIKARLKKYDLWDTSIDHRQFYQFALDPQQAIADLNKHRFKLVKKTGFDGIKGLKDEIKTLRKPLQKLYDSKSKSLFTRAAKELTSRSVAPLFHHSVLLIFQKES